MFRPIAPKLNINEMEESILRFWKEKRVFEATIAQRKGAQEYVFYEGPPTANGKPGVHHVEARVYKDMFPRYKIMNGYHVSRRGGWDTHGLPVEIAVEKKLGITNKQQIEEYGIEKFNDLCKRSLFEYIQDWEKLTDRIAFWVDMGDAYVTYTNDYIESVWWILKSLWERDLLYKGYKIVPYCPRCGTPLSDHEVAQGYTDAIDPSVFVRLPLVEKPGTSLLIWTTTPWTLPANVAVAAGEDIGYVTVECNLKEGGVERLILAEALLDSVFRGSEYRIIERFKGKKLKGTRYHPLFTFLPLDKTAHYVVLGEFVTTNDGTGLVHIAPAFGADDMEVSRKYNLPVLMTVGPDGCFLPQVTPWRGVFVKTADPAITADLEARGLLFRAETYTHTYPFCWRCDTPLLYYARESWYIRTSAFKDRLVELNKQINWIPEHIREGRFGNWLQNNVDWSLSRERYWGTPLPIWECSDCKYRECIGSIQELTEKSGTDLSDLDLHRPKVDEIGWACQKCEGKMTRVTDLIDVWFDSGSMPVAQWHYPFENKNKFENQFPADFIAEAVDQTRGWFYTLHAISTLLFDKPCYKNVICLGLVVDANGQKMSKSRGNVIDPWDVINESGADAFRWYFYTSGPPNAERRFALSMVTDVVKNFTLTLWNVYSFFVTYANLDKPELLKIFTPSNDLDRWLLSSLNVLVRDVTTAYEMYDVTGATRPIEGFVQVLSTWYLRRSRRRFWKSESDIDKQSAYVTLYTTLVTLSKLLAPTMPFLAEELYQNLVREVDKSSVISVHLAGWPKSNTDLIDDSLNRDMELIMKLVSLGHSARQKANRKVRQPLLEAAFALGRQDERQAVDKYAELLIEELNVKRVRLLDTSSDAATFSIKPLPKQLGQKYGSRFPAIQKVILQMDAAEVAATITSDQNLTVKMDDETLEILPDEVEVHAVARTGYAVASEGAYLTALVTELTPELIKEGLAREFVRRVQDLRKTAELDVADRIILYIEASPDLSRAITDNRDYVTSETLTVKMEFGKPEKTGVVLEDKFDNEIFTVWLERT